MGKELYFTRKTSNRGAKLFLVDPRTGEKGQDWLRVLGLDSDIARKAEIEYQRKVRDAFADADEVDKTKAREKVLQAMSESAAEDQIDKALALVTEWGGPNLEEPFTADALRVILEEAPQIVDAITNFSADRAAFFAAAEESLSATPKPSSASTNP